MKSMLVKLVASMASLMLLANILAGISIKNWTTAFFAALLLGVLNAVLKPILSLLTLPINFLTFGLFSFVLNAGLFGLAAYLLDGFEVNGLVSALLGSILYGIVSTILLWIMEWVVKPNSSASN
jgi:putative membrane protein